MKVGICSLGCKVNMYESEFKNIRNFIKQIHQVNKKLSLLFISTNNTNDLYNAVYFVLVGVIAIFVILFIYKSYSK